LGAIFWKLRKKIRKKSGLKETLHAYAIRYSTLNCYSFWYLKKRILLFAWPVLNLSFVWTFLSESLYHTKVKLTIARHMLPLLASLDLYLPHFVIYSIKVCWTKKKNYGCIFSLEHEVLAWLQYPLYCSCCSCCSCCCWFVTHVQQKDTWWRGATALLPRHGITCLWSPFAKMDICLHLSTKVNKSKQK
jgi:hypothetical protein